VYVLDAYSRSQLAEALIGKILSLNPKARFLVVSEEFTVANAFPLLRLGVKGLLTYREASSQLPRALEAVASRGFWVPRTLLSRFVDSVLTVVHTRRLLSGPADVSRREKEILEGVLDNLSNKEIANKLRISGSTVKFHVSNLLAKYGVQRRSDLILLYFQRTQTSPGAIQ